MGFEQAPGVGIGHGPVFPEDAQADGASILELAKAFLDSDADVSASAAGSVAVDEFEDGVAAFTGGGEFAIEMGKSLMHGRHASFEIDHRNEDRRVATARHGLIPGLRFGVDRVNPAITGEEAL
jgi:hypothetical protein